MIKVVILQELVPPYRTPFFEGLSALNDLDVVVLHSDAGEHVGSLPFPNHRVGSRRGAGFATQSGTARWTRGADVVVAMFDLRWLSMWREVICRPRRLVLWGHGFGRSAFGSRVRVALANRAALVVTYAQAGADSFLSAGLPVDKVLVADNTVLVNNHGIDGGVRDTFLFVGRLEARKNVDHLIEAYSQLSEDIKQRCRVVIIGDGTLRHLLEAKVRELQIANRVRFLGDVRDDPSLREQFSRALAYVSPGHVGLGVLHSFAYGVPVVTCDGPGHAPEFANIVSEVNGLVYRGGVPELRSCLRRLSVEESLSETLGRAAYDHYRGGRTMEHMIDQFSSAIRKANRT